LRRLSCKLDDNIFSVYLSEEFGQRPLQSPTVFYFFSPIMRCPGAISANGLTSRGIPDHDRNNSGQQANELYRRFSNPDYALDLSVEMGLASNPTA